jgi:hypothetical protein
MTDIVYSAMKNIANFQVNEDYGKSLKVICSYMSFSVVLDRISKIKLQAKSLSSHHV